MHIVSPETAVLRDDPVLLLDYRGAAGAQHMHAACAALGRRRQVVDFTFDTWHPARLPDIGGCVVIATNNPAVVDRIAVAGSLPPVGRFPPALVDDAVGMFVLVRQDGQLLQFDAEDAVEFLDAYRVGIQHVSEILLTNNLW